MEKNGTAALFVEAANILNEYGLTPKQLLKRGQSLFLENEELLETIKAIGLVLHSIKSNPSALKTLEDVRYEKIPNTIKELTAKMISTDE